MKRILGLSAVVVLCIGAFSLCGAVYLHHRGTIHLHDRAMVRAKLETCRAIYNGGGIPALHAYISRESTDERNTTFVEVLDANKNRRFSQVPATERNQHSLQVSTDPAQKEWPNLPHSNGHQVWTIARAVLPDGSLLYVGHARQDGHWF